MVALPWRRGRIPRCGRYTLHHKSLARGSGLFFMKPTSKTTAAPTAFLEPADFDELDAILDNLRTRYDETPQWEFCEGFMAAVICSRRPMEAAEYLPVLLAVPSEGEAPDPEGGSFASEA